MSLEKIYKFRDGKLGVELEGDEEKTNNQNQSLAFINKMRSKEQQAEWERDVLIFIQGGPELSDKYEMEDGREDSPDDGDDDTDGDGEKQKQKQKQKQTGQREEIHGRQYKHFLPNNFDWLPQGMKKSPKQKVNERCACGSGLKYKKCCLNGN